jgi:vacuolar-type H+-ATPase subunit E/Vma4
MGAGELLEKIRLDGRERVAAVEAERVREVEEITRHRDAELGALEREFGERTSHLVMRIGERARSQARLERRKALLAAQWQVVDRVLGRARAMLLDDPDYPGLLKQLAAQHVGAVVRLSKTDTERFGRDFKDRLGEPADVAGGLLVVQGRQVTDLSLDEVFVESRGDLALAIVRELFPGAAMAEPSAGR